MRDSTVSSPTLWIKPLEEMLKQLMLLRGKTETQNQKKKIIDLPEAEKKADALRGAFIKRVLDGVAHYGVVQDIEQGKEDW